MPLNRELNILRFALTTSGIDRAVSSTLSAYNNVDATRILNDFNTDIIFPTKYQDLSQHIYFANAYFKTKNILDNLIATYPIGITGSSTALLYKEDIDNAILYIKSLDGYQYWCLKQLCGETLTTHMSFTANATAVPVALSTSSSGDWKSLPYLTRDINNSLLYPQGAGSNALYDQNFTNNQFAISDRDVSNSELSYYENVLQTAIGFDRGVQTVLTDMSGTGSDNYYVQTYDDVIESTIIPNLLNAGYSRAESLDKLIEGESFEDDEGDVLLSTLSVFAGIYDELKVYIDNYTNLFRNYWGNFNNIPKGNIQKLVAFQLGVELFDSSNNSILDSYVFRNKTPKEATWEFWNRILCALPFIYKTKGSIESIKAAARAYGLQNSFVDIYELTDSIYANFYKIIRTKSTAVAKLGYYSTTDTRFQSITTNLGSLSGVYSPQDQEDFSVNFRLKFIDDMTDNDTNGNLGGVLFYNSNSGIYIAYDTYTNSVGERFIRFLFECGASSLTSDYNFISQIKKNNPYGWNTFSFDRYGKTMSIRSGFILQSLIFEDPITSSVTASTDTASLTSLNYAIGHKAIGGLAGRVFLQELQLHKGFISPQLFERKVRNYENIETPSAIIFAYKLRENVSFALSGKNYIIDSGPNSLTGGPTLTGTFGNGYYPYEYEYDLTKEYITRQAGFSIRNTDDIGTNNQTVDSRDLRVGISIAAAVNADMQNVAGDISISDLMADPSYVFNTTLFKAGEKSTVIGTKNKELISRYNNVGTIVGSILHTTDRIHGHLASYYSFLDQIMPVSRNILEKGIIIEDITTSRQVIQRQTLGFEEEDIRFTQTATPVFISSAINDPSPSLSSGIVTAGYSIGTNTYIDGSTVASANMIQSINPLIPIIFSAIGEEHSLTGSISASIGATSTNSDSYGRISLRTIDKSHYRYHIGYEKIFDKIKTNNLTSSIMSLSFENRNIFISSDPNVDSNLRSITGHIFIVDNDTGNFLTTEYDAIEVDFSNCLSGNLNRLRFIVNGVDFPYNQNIMRFNLPFKYNTQFIITSVSSVNEGVASAAPYKVVFRNLLSPSDDPQSIELNFYISDNIESMTEAKGFVMTSNIS